MIDVHVIVAGFDIMFYHLVVIVHTVIDVLQMFFHQQTPDLFSILLSYFTTAFGLLAIEVASAFIGRGYGDQSRLGGAALALSIHVSNV